MATRKPLVLVGGQTQELPVGDDIGITSGGAGIGVHVNYTVPVGGFAHLAVNALAMSTIAAAANRFDMMPFIPERTYTYDQLSLEVTTLIAASQGRLGIYANNNGVPGALIVQGAAVIDCSTVGDKVASITATTLTAGTPYWLAVASSSTQTYRALALGGVMPLQGNATANLLYTLSRATLAFASLPANAPAGALGSANVPHIRLRRSA